MNVNTRYKSIHNSFSVLSQHILARRSNDDISPAKLLEVIAHQNNYARAFKLCMALAANAEKFGMYKKFHSEWGDTFFHGGGWHQVNVVAGSWGHDIRSRWRAKYLSPVCFFFRYVHTTIAVQLNGRFQVISFDWATSMLFSDLCIHKMEHNIELVDCDQKEWRK